MALSRRQRHQLDIWPGFVDALATLLMVIIFLLMIFVVSQLYLNDALVGRDKALEELNQQVSELSQMLSMERASNEDLRSELETLSTQLKASLVKRDDLQTSLSSITSERDDLKSALEEKKSEQEKLSTELADAYKTIDASEAKVQMQLKQIVELEHSVDALKALKEKLENDLKDKVATAEEQGRLLEKSRQDTLEAQAEAALLNKQLQALRQQIAELNKLLDASEAKDEEAQAQIKALGKRLNQALASKVYELARYRSEFFGKLREILGDRKDIQIVGDRFVFQSEVFFATGSDEIGEEGRRQLEELAQTLKVIEGRIPSDIDWILQVEGHTDSVPISTERFPSNWELSAARAISVVKFLIAQGIPASHLSAAGFADKQPLDPRNDEIANRRNRRIELRLTQR